MSMEYKEHEVLCCIHIILQVGGNTRSVDDISYLVHSPFVLTGSLIVESCPNDLHAKYVYIV